MEKTGVALPKQPKPSRAGAPARGCAAVQNKGSFVDIGHTFLDLVEMTNDHVQDGNCSRKANARSA
eukprot:6474999-Amphidinium_carterae.1